MAETNAKCAPLLIAASLGALAGCSAEDDGSSKAAGLDVEPVYALVAHVWSDDGPTGYVALTNTLEVEEVSLTEAREFSGYASVAVANGQLLVNPSAEDPTIERYRITDALDWVSAGTALSFLNEGPDQVGFYKQYRRGDREALVDVDVVGRVVWDPLEFSIQGAAPDVVLPMQRDGLDLFANLNRTYFVFDGDVLQPFSYHDQDWFRWSPDTEIVVYGALDREPKDILHVACPGLDSITRDEQGNTYLATWEYSALTPLMGTGPAPCVVRLTPENQIDLGWNPDLRDLTGGREIVNFRYVGHGKAIAAVLHDEEYGDDYDFSTLAENVDDFWAFSSQFHRLWMFDLDARTAVPVEGIDDFEFVNPWFFHAAMDGRTFVFLGEGSANNNNPPTTVIYELDGAGHAERRFEVEGGVVQWLRVR
jgi:hypothetical protein